MSETVYRQAHRAQVRQGYEEELLSLLGGRAEELAGKVRDGQLLTVSVFQWGRTVFAYSESVGCPVFPDELFGDLSAILELWPGEERPGSWAPMMDVYHGCEPVSLDFWKRKKPVFRAYATVNRLKPEMVSSYIFYHYQYQEEKPGDWSKYAAIYLHENLMFFYQEEPDGPVTPPYVGKLDTRNTPGQWQELMNRHFMPWPGDPELREPWRAIATIFHV